MKASEIPAFESPSFGPWLWGGKEKEEAEKLYLDDDCYVFSRPQHDATKYYAYSKADKGKMDISGLITPAFPTYLTPSGSFLRQICSAPGFDPDRPEKFRERLLRMYGTFVVSGATMDRMRYSDKKTRLMESSVAQTTRYLRDHGQKGMIYSVYKIFRFTKKVKRKDGTKKEVVGYYMVEHKGDITRKYNGDWSLKSNRYSLSLPDYFIKLTHTGTIRAKNKNTLQTLYTDFRKTISRTTKSESELKTAVKNVPDESIDVLAALGYSVA